MNNPGLSVRSQLLTITGLTRCVDNFPHIKKWSITLLDSSTDIDLSSNPTSNTASLVIQQNYLSYGLYQITYQIYSMQDLISPLSSEVTYIKIIPTGISVYGLEYGKTYLKVGFAQEIVFQPNIYSFDFDFIADISLLEFRYYCLKINITENTNSTDFGDELKTSKLENKKLYSSCFNSTSKLI